MTDLKLGSINLGNDTWSIAATTLLDNSTAPSVSVAADKSLSQALNGYGTLKLDSEGVLTLQGGSKLTGEVSIVEGDGTEVSLSAVSFGAAVSVALNKNDHQSLKTVIGSSSADSISVSGFDSEEFVLNAGAGNDTVVASGITKGKVDAGAGADLVSVTGAVNEVVLGAGKDTLVFGEAATVAASDYNFSDDVIVLGAATLGDNGNLYNSDSVVSGLTAANGVFLARTTDGSNTTVYATAENDASKVVIDASSIKDKNVIIDAKSADSANITLGKATLAVVSLKAGNDAVDTIKIGDTKAAVSVNVTGFSTDDVLNFTGLTLKNSTIGVAGSAVTLGSGKVSLNLGTAATVTGGAKFNLNGTTLYATTSDSNVLDLTEETDLSKILVKGQNDVSKKSGIKTSAKLVNLDADNIYNIDYVELTADTAAKASVIGTKNDKAGITIDASKATDGVAVWANNSSTKDGVKDMISLSSAEAVDTLWFGSADGKDSVSGFQLESDVLYLYDSTTMTAKDGVLKIGKAEMSVKATATEEIMQVQGAKFAGTVYAAGDFNGGNTDIALGENAGKVNYYAVDKNASIVLSDKMTDSYTFLKDIDYAGASKANIAAGGSVASINASAITDTDAKVIIEGVANVSLGAGTNEVWVNGADNNATVVASASASGSDKIWFSASDKNVTVSGFDTESDVIALMGTIGEFTAKMDSTNAVISNASKGKLTLDKTSDINLVDANGAKYKLYVDTADYTTNTDGTNIYLGAQLNASSEVTAATNIVVEGANNKWGIASSAIVGKDVKTIDMSSSSADFVLIGSANASNTITGGMGTNYLNGGGASKDVLNGNTGAVDFFYYGKEDGNDTLMNVGTEDTVVLYDIASTDLTATPKVTDEKTVITLNNDDSKLTIIGGIDGVTFQLTDGAYKYDSSADEKWVKQNV